MHYYKKNLGDYAKKAGRLTMLQHGAYTLLIDSCYDRERFPKSVQEAIDWVWASNPEEIQAVEFVLQRFFDENEDGYFVQKRVKEEIENYHKRSVVNKRIAQERETNRKKQSTKRVPSVNEAPPNQEPLTTNHKILTSNEVNSPTSTKSPVCPHQQIVNLYNQIIPANSGMAVKVRDWTPARKTALKARWKDFPDLDWWEKFFTQITASDFLMGKITNGTRDPFRIDLPWIIKQENFSKIREGKYHGQ